MSDPYFTKNRKKIKIDRNLILSLTIAVEHHLADYQRQGYSLQDINDAPEGSHFGDLRKFQALVEEYQRG